MQLLARLGAKPLLTGLEHSLFNGGAPPTKSIIELYGEDGCGKTEMLMHLVANCILPDVWEGLQLDGLGVAVILVDTDYHFSMLRLATVLELRIKRAKEEDSVKKRAMQVVEAPEEDTEAFISTCLNKLYVVRCNSSSQLILTLHSLEALLQNKPDICVMMIDSISAFYWIDRSNGADNFTAQETNQRQIVQVLYKLVNDYSLICFATKPAIFSKRSKDGDRSGVDSPSTAFTRSIEDKVDHYEYLCKAWHGLVTHRFVMSKIDKGQAALFQISSNGSDGKRCLKTFVITEAGIAFCS